MIDPSAPVVADEPEAPTDPSQLTLHLDIHRMRAEIEVLENRISRIRASEVEAAADTRPFVERAQDLVERTVESLYESGRAEIATIDRESRLAAEARLAEASRQAQDLLAAAREELAAALTERAETGEAPVRGTDVVIVPDEGLVLLAVAGLVVLPDDDLVALPDDEVVVVVDDESAPATDAVAHVALAEHDVALVLPGSVVDEPVASVDATDDEPVAVVGTTDDEPVAVVESADGPEVASAPQTDDRPTVDLPWEPIATSSLVADEHLALADSDVGSPPIGDLPALLVTGPAEAQIDTDVAAPAADTTTGQHTEASETVRADAAFDIWLAMSPPPGELEEPADEAGPDTASGRPAWVRPLEAVAALILVAVMIGLTLVIVG